MQEGSSDPTGFFGPKRHNRRETSDRESTAAMTRRNSDSNIPPLAIRLFYLAAVAVSLPLLMWSGLVQQMNASAGNILFWTRGPVHSPSVARIVLLLSTSRRYANSDRFQFAGQS